MQTSILQDKEPASLWWEAIAGPHMLVEAVSARLLSGCSLLLLTGDAFPWRWAFRGNIESLLAREDVNIEYIDCKDTYQGGEIGEFVLQQTAPSEIPAYLRCLKDPLEWLKRSRILDHRIIWFKGISDEHREQFLKFVNSYRSTSLYEGSLLLELEYPPGRAAQSKFVETINYHNFVTQTDLHLFCTLLALHYDVPPDLRDYAAAVITNLCATDGEVAEILFRRMDFSRDEPIKVLEDCFHNREFPLGHGAACAPGQAAHPFYLLLAKDQIQLIRRVWKAQLQVAFPKIELERLQLIEQYEQPIQEALHTQYWDFKKNCAKYVEQFGAAIQNPYDIELGTLHFMLQVFRANDREVPLLSVAPTDRKRIHFLVEMRNRKLAHIYNNQNCSPAEMSELL